MQTLTRAHVYIHMHIYIFALAHRQMHTVLKHYTHTTPHTRTDIHMYILTYTTYTHHACTYATHINSHKYTHITTECISDSRCAIS